MEEKNTTLVVDFGDGDTIAMPTMQIPVKQSANPEDMEKESLNRQMQHAIMALGLDHSISMSAMDSDKGIRRVDIMNQGARDFINNTVMTATEKENTDIEIVSFGGDVCIEKGFAPMSTVIPDFNFTPAGDTPFYSTLLVMVNDARKRKNEHIRFGGEVYNPLLCIITDGMPTDKHMKDACQRVLRKYVDGRKMSLIVFCLPGCDPTEMQELCERVQVVSLRNVDAISQAFSLMSYSIAKMSVSDVNSDLTIAINGLNGLGIVRRADGQRAITFNGGTDN